MEILEQLKLLKQLFSYGLVGEIVIAIGILITFFYQRHKIGSLEMQIKSQKGILDSAETFFNLFDLEKLKGYGEILVEKTKVEKETEIERIKANYEKMIAKHKDSKEKFEFIAGEFVVLIKSFMDTIFILPKNVRKQVIDQMGEGTIKQGMQQLYEKLEGEEREIRMNALSGTFAQSDWRKVIAKSSKKEGEPE